SHFNPRSLPVRFFRHWILSKPVIREAQCIACGQCTEICPVKPRAVAFTEGIRTPRYNYSRCIRCYCCQEVCPAGAIDIRTPVIGSLMRRFSMN
ncbi:MAG TPA: 4Fe-4S binding protein, partial [bacterium]|nr:4Fe-4S binding protein [bacterium]